MCLGKILKKLKGKEGKNLLDISSSKDKAPCDNCKEEFFKDELNHILHGPKIDERLCDKCLNERYGAGTPPLDEEEEKEEE